MKIFQSRESRLLALGLLIKLVLTLGVMAGAYFLFPFNKENYWVNFVYPVGDPISLKSAFLTWDARWYLSVADHWYTGDVSSNYYPLLPLCIFLLKPFVGNILAGFLVSNICFVVGAMTFFRLVKQLFSARTAWISFAFLCLFSTSFFFHLIYTESLFFMLIMLLFYAMHKRQLRFICLFAFLVPLVRPPGIGIVVPLAWYMLFEEKNSFGFKRPTSYIVLAMPILGFAAVHGIQWLFTGNLLAAFEAQKTYVAQNSFSNLLHPIAWFRRNFLHNALVWHGFTNSLLDRIIFLLFTIVLAAMWKTQKFSFLLFAAVMGLVPAFLGTFMAYFRYLAVVFPMFIGLAHLSECRPLLRYYLYAAFGGLQVFFIGAHALNYWVG